MKNKWQPIETAPKDGTRILVWDADDEQSFIASWSYFHTIRINIDDPRCDGINFIDDGIIDHGLASGGKIIPARSCRVYDWSSDELMENGYPATYNATHWMPLPDPPTPKNPA